MKRWAVTLRVVPLHQADGRAEREFWESVPRDERFAEAWRLAVDAWTFAGPDVGEPGLPRRTARVVRR